VQLHALGGCASTLPAGCSTRPGKVVAGFPAFLDEYEALLVGNEILMERTRASASSPKELAINSAISGPMAAPAESTTDIRKIDHYGSTTASLPRAPRQHGDVYDRTDPFLEMRESLKILNDAMRDLPDGPSSTQVEAPRFPPQARRGLRPHRIAKGELGFYLIRDGSPKPYRYRLRPPSLINLTILEEPLPRSQRRGRRRHPGQRRHRIRRGRPDETDELQRMETRVIGNGILKGLTRLHGISSAATSAKERLTTVQYPESACRRSKPRALPLPRLRRIDPKPASAVSPARSAEGMPAKCILIQKSPTKSPTPS